MWMRNPALICVALAIIVLAPAACGQDDGFIAAYGGDPYTGSVRVVVDSDAAPGGAMRRRGDGSAQFERTGPGEARLVVFGALDDGDAGFSMVGAHDGSGWRANAGAIRLSIDEAGKLSGGGVSGAQRYTLSGTVTSGKFDLKVELEPMPQAGQPAPAARLFTFNYRLRREADDESAAGGRDTAAGGRCRKIRYEMRPVASMGDGSMSMLNVPVCLK